MTPIERYRDTENRLCEYYDLDADSSFVELDGPVDRVHYLEAGTGEPMVLIHGGAGNTAATWVPLMASLESRFRLYALDVPGDGLSDPLDFGGVDYREFTGELFDAFMDAIDAASAAFVGNSRGGYQSLVVALDHAERVDSVVLVGAVGGFSSRIPLPLRLMGTPWLNRLLIPLVWKPNMDAVRTLYEGFVVDDSAVPAVFYECVAHNRALPGRVDSQRTWAESVVRLRGVAPELLIREDVRELDVPTCFLWGDRDGVTPPSVGREVAEEMRHAVFVELEDTGHMPWLEPDTPVPELIADFVTEGSVDRM